MHVLGPAEIAQAVHPPVGQLSPGRQAVDHEVVRGPREQDLAAVRELAQPRAAAQRQPEVVALVAQLRLRRVQRDAHPQRRSLGPGVCAHATLDLERRGDGIRAAREGGDDAVALSLLDRPHSSVKRHRLLQQRVVLGHCTRHRLWLVLPQPHRTLDVAQQEGDRAGR